MNQKRRASLSKLLIHVPFLNPRKLGVRPLVPPLAYTPLVHPLFRWRLFLRCRRSLHGHQRPHASFHLHSRPSVQATEGTPIFVQQGEQQGPMLVLTPHAKLGRRIRCPLALHMPPRRRLTDGLRLTQCLCRTHLHVRLPRRPRRHRNAQLECPMRPAAPMVPPPLWAGRPGRKRRVLCARGSIRSRAIARDSRPSSRRAHAQAGGVVAAATHDWARALRRRPPVVGAFVVMPRDVADRVQVGVRRVPRLQHLRLPPRARAALVHRDAVRGGTPHADCGMPRHVRAVDGRGGPAWAVWRLGLAAQTTASRARGGDAHARHDVQLCAVREHHRAVLVLRLSAHRSQAQLAAQLRRAAPCLRGCRGGARPRHIARRLPARRLQGTPPPQPHHPPPQQ